MTITKPENTVARKKAIAVCRKCKSALESRAHRSWFVKTFLFWLALRKFKCYKCKRTQYVLIGK